MAVKYKPEDKVRLHCTRAELCDIGIIDDEEIGWLLDGHPKKIIKVDSRKITLEHTRFSLWVYDTMVYRIKSQEQNG